MRVAVYGTTMTKKSIIYCLLKVFCKVSQTLLVTQDITYRRNLGTHSIEFGDIGNLSIVAGSTTPELLCSLDDFEPKNYGHTVYDLADDNIQEDVDYNIFVKGSKLHSWEEELIEELKKQKTELIMIEPSFEITKEKGVHNVLIDMETLITLEKIEMEQRFLPFLSRKFLKEISVPLSKPTALLPNDVIKALGRK
jgi:hypothetical protein